ncbi:MAG: hypothetical protein JNM58_00475 [Xanthomonadaceae bacterium]|nr:hypothetical protein [Xanthomonadaceae bacterium]
MNTVRNAVLALALSAPLLGCGNDATQDPADEPKTIIGQAVKQATDEARKEIAKENFSIGSDGMPKAEITPEGDLLIDGKSVTTTPEQKALAMAYRQELTTIAQAGIGIGVQGADLAGKAVSEAVKGVFSGNPDQIEQRIEKEAEGIKSAAKQLCDRLPALKAAQDKLAAAVPEFKPYARMDESDVKDCRVDAGDGLNIDTDVANDEGSSNDGMNAAEEAEAASAKPAS